MSFGLSRGRTLESGRWGITMADLPPFDHAHPEACRLDPRTWFDEPSRRFEIEIGSGKGTFLVQQAPLTPDTNYLGIEWAGEFYRYAADRMRRHAFPNVRMLHADATQFLRFWCADGCAAVIHLYFSDPWPKKRHHKRRVLQDDTLAVFHRILTPGGELRLVTDHDDLWTWYEALAQRHAATFAREAFEAPPSAADGELVGTNYERKFARVGKPFHALTLRRRD
jgi:tRNA (guanine-N7-)-methyltransferase